MTINSFFIYYSFSLINYYVINGFGSCHIVCVYKKYSGYVWQTINLLDSQGPLYDCGHYQLSSATEEVIYN